MSEAVVIRHVFGPPAGVVVELPIPSQRRLSDRGSESVDPTGEVRLGCRVEVP
jgi:hypothetical protein